MQSDPGALRIGGLVPFSSVDFPSKLSAAVFCQGCPWRCVYCHNPHLQPFTSGNLVPWTQVRSFLNDRRGLLDGVVFSGGEPTAQHGLVQAILEIRSMGFSVGLHTAGMYPRRLANLLRHVNWVGMDIKAPFDRRYDQITGVPASWRPVLQSLEMLMHSGVEYRLRTTVDSRFTNATDQEEIVIQLEERGARRPEWQIARAVPETNL